MTAPLALEPFDPASPPPQKHEQPEGKPQTYGDPTQPGKLLALPPEEAAKKLLKMVIEQHPIYKRRLLEWEVNSRRLQGESNVWITKTKDQSSYQIYIPPGAGKGPGVPVMNQAERVCRRLGAKLYADEPAPDPQPDTGSDEDRDAAEFTERALLDVQSESTLNTLQAHRLAFTQIGSCYGSGYIHTRINPKGGGRQPVEVESSPQAQFEKEALQNPMTGQPWGDELVSRYVAEDGMLGDDPSQAALQWVPKLSRDIYTAAGVRFLPADALDLWDAEAVILLAYRPKWDLVERHAELESWGDEQWEKACKYRPAEFKALLPLIDGKHKELPCEDKDDELALETIAYFMECGRYPDGLRIVTVGEGLAVREPWVMMFDVNKKVTDPTADPNAAPETVQKREALDIPVTQLKQFEDELGNGHGKGLMSLLGTGTEFRAHVVGVVADLLDRHSNRKTFVPVHSTFNPAKMAFSRYVPINAGGKPEDEEVPDIPQVVPYLIDFTTKEIDDTAGLQNTADNLSGSDVQSGRQALAIVSQVESGLSDLNQNCKRAYVRDCRIQGQLIRKDYKRLQRISWVGDDGEYKERRWMGSDLGSTRDVRIKQGTMTMMTQTEKAMLVQGWTQMGWEGGEEALNQVVSKAGGMIGVQDDPHVMRARLQVSRWEQGPPKDFEPPAPPPVDPMMGPQLDPMTGQPIPPPNPFQEILAGIFDVRPVDGLPPVALKRLREFGRAMAGTRYGNFDVAWRAGLDEAFGMAQMAAQPPMPQVGPDGKPMAPPLGQDPSQPTEPPPLQEGEAAVLEPNGAP